MSESTYDWRITDHGMSDEGLVSFAELELLIDGEVVQNEHFSVSHEFGSCATAREAAASFAVAWHEACTTTLEERLGAFGLEWEREQSEREGWL